MGANNSKSSGKAAAATPMYGKTSQFEALPDDVAKQVFMALSINEKAALARTSTRTYGLFSQHIHAAKLLMLVAHGEQEPAAHILESKPELLLERADVTDYSGRTFKNITAYEYAYWAKDTHMCRMLERHMDANRATIMHQRCLDIDKNGLTYEQHGVVIEPSPHFDLTPLKSALQGYVDGYDNWVLTSNWREMEAAWMAVGMAQRDVPVHVANEYCRTDLRYNPKRAFNEDTLPRNLKLREYNTDRELSWFPLVVSASPCLGVDFTVTRARTGCAGGGVNDNAHGEVGRGLVSCDLAAVTRLDEARTLGLKQSLETLTLISRLGGCIGRPGM